MNTILTELSIYLFKRLNEIVIQDEREDLVKRPLIYFSARSKEQRKIESHSRDF